MQKNYFSMKVTTARNNFLINRYLGRQLTANYQYKHFLETDGLC